MCIISNCANPGSFFCINPFFLGVFVEIRTGYIQKKTRSMQKKYQDSHKKIIQIFVQILGFFFQKKEHIHHPKREHANCKILIFQERDSFRMNRVFISTNRACLKKKNGIHTKYYRDLNKK